MRDVCDIAQCLTGGSRAAWWVTAIMFLTNNTFIQVNTSSGLDLFAEGSDQVRACIAWSERNT